jgi:ubiquinone/menaquinone biosynthesis C-methylase UbiE
MYLTNKFTRFVESEYPNWDVTIALRYFPIAKTIKKRLKRDSKILDVGSGEFGLATYIKGRYRITGTDIDFGGKRGRGFRLVKSTADKLPFRDDCFDAVVSVDMLEHLSSKERGPSIREMIRVSKRFVILAFPCGTISQATDKIISRYYLWTHKKPLEYLKEHKKYGLPKKEEVVSIIEKELKRRGKEVRYKIKGNTNIFLWIFLLFLGFSERRVLTYLYHKMLVLLPILQKLNFWPSYRAVITVELEGAL